MDHNFLLLFYVFFFMYTIVAGIFVQSVPKEKSRAEGEKESLPWFQFSGVRRFAVDTGGDFVVSLCFC